GPLRTAAVRAVELMYVGLHVGGLAVVNKLYCDRPRVPRTRGSGLSPRFDLSFGNSIDLPPDLRALVASRICLFFLSVRWPSFFCRVFSDTAALLLARSLKLRPLHATRTRALIIPATLRACTRESDSTTLALLL